jgi:hypothetical protein
MSNDINFTRGLFFNEPHEKAPDFVIGSLSISRDNFMEWLEQQEPNEKGYVRVAIKRSKEGKIYCALDTYEAKGRQEQPKPAAQDFGGFDDDEELPF